MIDLCVRLDGACRPKTIYELYQKNCLVMNGNSLQDMKKEMVPDFMGEELQEFMVRHNAPIKVMQLGFDLERIAYECVLDLHAHHVDYAEIRFAPHRCQKGDMDQMMIVQTVVNGISRGVAQYPDMKIGLVLSLRREAKDEENLETIEVARRLRGTPVCGLEIIGNETIYPLKGMEKALVELRRLNLPFGVSIGANGTKEDLAYAGCYGAKRLSNVILDDEESLRFIKDKGIFLEVSPWSDFRLGTVEKLIHHPMKKQWEYGIRMAPETMYPGSFHVDINDEYRFIREFMDFTYCDCMKMMEYAREAAYLKK